MKLFAIITFVILTSSVSAQQNQTILLINGSASFGPIPANRIARISIQSNQYKEFELHGSGCQIVKVGDQWFLQPNIDSKYAFITVRAEIDGQFYNILRQSVALN